MTSLYHIESDLQQLSELREQAEAEGDSEALKVIDDQIASYLSQEAGKIDSYVGLIRKRMDDAAACELEADRLNQRAKTLLADVDRLKANALAVMQQFDVKAISSQTNTIRRQKNGGLQPLEIPEWPKDASGNFKALPHTLGDVRPIPVKFLVVPDTEAIRKALAVRVKCPECDGLEMVGSIPDGTCSIEPCPRCHGAGTIPATVPGARLLERGEQVRIL